MHEPDIHGFSPDDPGPLVGFSRDEPAREVHVSGSALSRHLLVLGRSGVGKSTLIRHILSHRLDRKAAGRDDDAIVVIDPHGDLVRDLLGLVPPAIAGRVRLLDFGDRDRIPSLNLLDPMAFPDRDRCVEALLDTFRISWDHWSSRMEGLLRSMLLSIYEYNSHPDTPCSEMMTVLDVSDLLLDSPVRRERVAGMSILQRHVLGRVRDPGLRDWANRFLVGPLGARSDMDGPLLSHLNSYSSHAGGSLVMRQRESLLDLPEFLRGGGILLVSTALGSLGRVPSALLGSSLIRLVESELRDREAGAGSRCLLVCEGFQFFPGAGWEGLLSDARRLGCSLLLSCQGLDENPGLRVLRDFGCIAGFQMGAADARALSFEMGTAGASGERRLMNQHPFEFRFRVSPSAGVGPAPQVRLLPPRLPVHDPGESERAIRASSLSCTVDREEARERIQHDLAQRLEAPRIGFSVRSEPP